MIGELIDHINSLYSGSFGDFTFRYEVIYETTRYKNGKHIDFSTDWKTRPDPRSNAMRCLSSASARIGFWENHDPGNERFHSLFILRAGACGVSIQATPLIRGKKYGRVKRMMLSILYGEVREIVSGGHKLICTDLYPDLRTEIKKFYSVDSDGNQFKVESIDKLKPPFKVNDMEYQFIAPRYLGNLPHEIDSHSIMGHIQKRYRFIEKTFLKYYK